MTAAETLHLLSDVGFTAVALVVLAEWCGYTEAERRAVKVEKEYVLKGEDVPEELKVPWSLLPDNLRVWGNVAVKVGFIMGATCLVAYYLVK